MYFQKEPGWGSFPKESKKIQKWNQTPDFAKMYKNGFQLQILQKYAKMDSNSRFFINVKKWNPIRV